MTSGLLVGGVHTTEGLPPGVASPRSVAGRARQPAKPPETTVTAPRVVDVSDHTLQALVREALDGQAELSRQPIGVAVRHGWVTLTGEVSGAREKRLAENAIHHIAGVKGISNNLIFESEALAWKIGERIGDSFARAAELAAHRVLVNVHDRKVILCGTVRSRWERDAAFAAAWEVPGVAEVINRLQVREN